MRIAICDDNQIFLEAFRQQLNDVAETSNIHTFSTAEKLLQCCETGSDFDVVFLDLALEKSTSGIQVAEVLYRIVPAMQIVYITGYTEQFVQDVFLHKGNISGFLTKPIDEKMLLANLKKIEQNRISTKNYLTLQTKNGIDAIVTEDILYLESTGHLVTVHTVQCAYYVYEKLSNVLKRLPANFVQCHKSFVVNFRYIQRFNTKEILLKTGAEIPVSRSKFAETKDAYFAFIGSEM